MVLRLTPIQEALYPSLISDCLPDSTDRSVASPTPAAVGGDETGLDAWQVCGIVLRSAARLTLSSAFITIGHNPGSATCACLRHQRMLRGFVPRRRHDQGEEIQ